MDTSIFERIKSGDGREKRVWAESLYTSLKAMLTGEGYRNPIFESALNQLSREEQTNYITRAIDAIKSVETHFKSYALVETTPRTDKLTQLVQENTIVPEDSKIEISGFNHVFQLQGDTPYTGSADRVMLVWHPTQNVPAEQYRKAHFSGNSVDLVVCEDPNGQLAQLGKERALIYHFS